MGKDLKIEINLSFGSEYQKEFILGIFETILPAIRGNFEGYHKRNKMDFKIGGKE